jgi:hypothetical protein
LGPDIDSMGSAQLPGQDRKRFGAPRHENEIEAQSRQLSRKRRADPLGCSGDQGRRTVTVCERDAGRIAHEGRVYGGGGEADGSGTVRSFFKPTPDR